MDKYSQINILSLSEYDSKEEWVAEINKALQNTHLKRKVETFEFHNDYTICVIVYHCEN